MSKLHGIDASGRHLIISLTADDFYEDATDDIRLYSRHDRAWVVLDAETLKPVCFLDIPPDDRPMYLFRGRWLVIHSATDKFMVNGRNVDYSDPEEYIFDIDTSRRLEATDGHRLNGGYINTKDNRAISLANGSVVTYSFLRGHDLLDYDTLGGGGDAMTTSITSAVLGSSPASPSFLTGATKVYVTRKKTMPTDHIVYIGVGGNSRLSPVMHFSGVYWHTLGGYIAFNNQVCKVPLNGVTETIMTFDASLTSNGLAMVLRDVYFPRVGEVCLLYESRNFHAIIVKKIGAAQSP